MSRPPITVDQLTRAGHVVVLNVDGSLSITPVPPDDVLGLCRSWAEHFVAELVALPGCDRCRCRPSRLVPTYWGQRLCPPCAQDVAAQHDRASTWPPQSRAHT